MNFRSVKNVMGSKRKKRTRKSKTTKVKKKKASVKIKIKGSPAQVSKAVNVLAGTRSNEISQ